MSEENVELLQRALEGYNRRDIEAMLEIWHPEAEWYPFTAQVEATRSTTVTNALSARLTGGDGLAVGSARGAGRP